MTNVKKFWVWSLILLGILLCVAFVWVLTTRKTEEKKVEVKEKIILSGDLTQSKVILDWIEKQRDKNGNYINGIRCSVGDKSNCDEVIASGTSGHDVIQTIWARYLFYKKVGDSADLEIITKDLKNYADRTKFHVQTDFWNCRMMYEMYRDVTLTKEQIRDVTNICWGGSYYELRGFTKASLTNTGEYDLSIEKTVPEIDLTAVVAEDPNVTKNLVETNEVSELNLPMYAAYPSEYVARYQWKRGQHEMDLAKLYFNVVLTVYLKDNKSFDNETTCRFGISAVDMWRGTNDKKYLDFASYLFNKEIAPAAKTAIDFRKYVRPTCGLLADEMYIATTSVGFKEKRDDIVKYLKLDYRDTDQSNNLIVNDGIFYMGGNNGFLIPEKEIRTNSLISALFSKL